MAEEGRKWTIKLNGTEYELLNMTPHAINWKTLSIPSVGTIRLSRGPSKTIPISIGSVNGEAVTNAHFTGIVCEPERILAGYALIVSMPVADFLVQQHLCATCAIITPDTGPESVIRDSEGRIQGVRRFIVHRH
jgi:hypothetical protein